MQPELPKHERLALVDVLVGEGDRAGQAALDHGAGLRIVVEEEHAAGVQPPRLVREVRRVDERALREPRDRAGGRAEQDGEVLDGRLQHPLLRPLAAEGAACIPELTQRDVAKAALPHAVAELPVEDVEARAVRARLAVVGERDRGVLAGPLRGEEREVGLADELLLRLCVRREGRDPGGQCRADETLCGRPSDPIREQDSRSGLAVDDDGELVAADAERLLAGAAVLGERPRELAQDAVARRMPLVVVQALEVVEVEEDERRLGRPGVGVQQRPVEVLLEGAVVAELREGIAPGLGVCLREPAGVGERGAGELGHGGEQARVDADLRALGHADEKRAEELASRHDRSDEGLPARGAVALELRQLRLVGGDEPRLVEPSRDDPRRAERLAREEAHRRGLHRRAPGAEQVDGGRPAAGDLPDVANDELRDRRGVGREGELARETQHARGLREQALRCLRRRGRRLVPPTLHVRAASFDRSFPALLRH